MGAQGLVVGAGVAGLRHQPGHQAALAIGRTFVGDGGTGHGRNGRQHRLDLARLDAKAADLELAVEPAQVLDATVVQPAGGVATAVEQFMAVAEGVGHEALGGGLGPVQIAQGQAGAADVQLAGKTGRDRLTLRAQDADVGPVDRPAERHAGMGVEIVLADRTGDGEGGGFGGAVAIDEPQAGQGLQRLAHVAWRQGLAARHQRAQALQVCRILVDQPVEECGGQPGGVDLFLLDDGGQALAGGDGFGVDDDGAAVEQRAPDLDGRGIEGERGCMQHHHLRAEGGKVLPVDQADDGTVRDDDALRGSGRAGGVHHVGRVPGRTARAHQRLFGDLLGKLRHGGAGQGDGVLVQVGIDVPDRDAGVDGQLPLAGAGVAIDQQQGWLAVGQHQRHPLCGAGGVDRHVDGVQAQDGEQQGDALRAS